MRRCLSRNISRPVAPITSEFDNNNNNNHNNNDNNNYLSNVNQVENNVTKSNLIKLKL